MTKYVFYYPGDDLSARQEIPVSVSGEGERKVLGTGVYDEKNHTITVELDPESEGAEIIQRYFSSSLVGGVSIHNDKE